MLKTLSFILFCTNTLKHAVFIFFTEKQGEKAQREFIGWSDSPKVTKQVKARTESGTLALDSHPLITRSNFHCPEYKLSL